MTRNWEPKVPYKTGDVVEYRGQKYKVIQGHTSQDDWAPGPATAALFQHISSDEHVEPPKQEHEPCHVHEHPQELKHPPIPTIDSERSPPDSSVSVSIPAPVHVQDTELPKQHSFQSRDEWLQDARRRTDEFHRNGPRAPTTWVIVNGHEIPRDALAGGMESDGSRQLFVARAYVEDGLYIGKAGKHLGRGAEIGRNHVRHQVQEYEILIGDPRGVRWVEAEGVPNPAHFGGRPIDAGVDAHGYRLFVVQVDHKGGIHPARASSGASGACVAYGDGELIFQEYRVLCYA